MDSPVDGGLSGAAIREIPWIDIGKLVAPRICSRIAFQPETGCWIWQGRLEGSGGRKGKLGSPAKYARFELFGRKWYVHIVAWMLAYHSHVPLWHEIDHRCRQTACVNPDHLEAVPRWVNKQRRDVAQGLLGFPALQAGGVNE